MRWSAWESVMNAASKRAGRSLTMVLLCSLQLLLLSPFRVVRPQAPAAPAERLAAREWFRQAGFGLFIHWGVYSQLGAGEWVMQNREIPAATYEWLASEFNPVKFDAHEWVSLARTAGARYITITSRHHDGFSMFATKATTYNIVEASPFKRDPLKELADECHRQGIKLFFYYSQLDWHHPDYFPRGGTGKASGRPDSGNWMRYIAFMNQQLTELLTNYGPIGGIWFDGMWDKPNADWHLADTYGLIHRLQPAALIVPNHHRAPLADEDVQTFEQDLPGANTAGFNTNTIGTLPLETSLTMNNSWGFNITDNAWKTTRELVGYLVRAAGSNANLLLNIGPRPDGTIQPEAAQHLHEMGEWLQTYGTSIYNTRGGPISPRSWGVTTQRGDTVFVHLLDWKDRLVAIPVVGMRVTRASMLDSGTAVEFEQTPVGLRLTLPSSGAGEPDRVIVLRTVKGP
jgi:alpha-L-fucosidase